MRIDLTGEELTGVIIIGTGLRPFAGTRSPKSNIMTRPVDRAMSSLTFGRDLTGCSSSRSSHSKRRRLRHCPSYDDRYADPVHRALLPDDWHTEHTSNADDCLHASDNSGTRLSHCRKTFGIGATVRKFFFNRKATIENSNAVDQRILLRLRDQKCR